TQSLLLVLAFLVLAFLVFALLVVRRAGSSGAEEELATIRIGNVPSVRAVAAVLGLVAGHDDRRADLESVLRNATAHQRVWRAAFDHPFLGRPAGFLHIDVDPGVRVDPLRLADRAFELQRLVSVEFRGKGMMCT